jgi:hypothetical protein
VVGYLPRYRYPADPMLALGAATGFIWLLDLMAARLGVQLPRLKSRAVASAD